MHELPISQKPRDLDEVKGQQEAIDLDLVKFNQL